MFAIRSRIGRVGMSVSRKTNNSYNKLSRSLSTVTPTAAYNQTVNAFPSIVIQSDGNLSAQGPFAESQAQVSVVVKDMDVWILDFWVEDG